MEKQLLEVRLAYQEKSLANCWTQVALMSKMVAVQQMVIASLLADLSVTTETPLQTLHTRLLEALDDAAQAMPHTDSAGINAAGVAAEVDKLYGAASGWINDALQARQRKQ